jgi:predicted O-methyltransferase YrrM
VTHAASTNLDDLRANAVAAGFEASVEEGVGCLLTTLAASKPGGRILELGTGAGLGTAYLLRGASTDSQLVTIELDSSLSELARRQISDDRVQWVVADAGDWLDSQPSQASFDLVFADTWPGKFTHLDSTLDLLAQGGLYVIDDLLPQANWPDHHQQRVDELIAALESRRELATVRADWASGVMICANRTPQ